MLTILLALSAGVSLALGGTWLVRRAGKHKPDDRIYEVILALYLIRRRLHVAQFRIEVRREAAMLRRELRIEIEELRRQERSKP